MSDPEVTQPPVPPQKWRRVLMWLQVHPEVTIPLAAFVAGAVLGGWIF